MKTAKRSDPSVWKVALAFAAIYFLWGANFLAVRYAVEGIPPLLLMGIRSLLAAAALMAWGRLRGQAWPNRRQIVAAIPAGTLLFLGGHGLLAIAQIRVSSGVAALVFSTLPFWMVLFGGLGGVRSPWRLGIGLALGLVGVTVLLTPSLSREGGAIDAIGVMILLCASASWAAGSLKSRDPRLPPSIAMKAGLQLAAGGFALLALASLSGEWTSLEWARIPPHAWIGLSYMVLVGSLLCFGAYVWLLGVRNAAQVGSYTFVNPLVAVFLGWAVASEPVTRPIVWASILIVAGLTFVHSSGALASSKD